MKTEEIYLVFKSGAIHTNIPPEKIHLEKDSIKIDVAMGSLECYFEDVYSIGVISEEGSEVLWTTDVKEPLLNEVKRKLESLWSTPYKKYSDSCWQMDYLTSLTSPIDLVRIDNRGRADYFEKDFEVWAFKKLVIMFLNLLIKKEEQT